MSRKEVTAFLSDVLIKTRLSGIGKYWAREVSFVWYAQAIRPCPKAYKNK